MRNKHIFPNNYIGGFMIIEDVGARELPTEEGALLVRFPDNGIVKANQRDFEHLSAWSENTYLYEDGTIIVANVPGTGDSVPEGPRVVNQISGSRSWTEDGVVKEENWISGSIVRR